MTTTQRPATESERYRPSQFGAVGVIYGYGPDAEILAENVRAQCAEQGVSVDVFPIDGFEPGNSPLFALIVLVVRADMQWSPRVKRLVQDVLTTYRQRRPDGLAAVLQGRRQPGIAGVVEVLVLGSECDLDASPGLRALVDRACIVKYLRDPQESFDLYDFLCAGAAGTVIAGLPATASDELSTLWTHAESWGVTGPEQVHDIVRLLNEWRSHYENPRFTATHRPFRHAYPDAIYPNKAELGLVFPHPDANRLDLVLDHPDVPLPRLAGMSETLYKRKHDVFVSSGARVARAALGHVQRFHPTFRRSADRNGTRDAQPALNFIYNVLVTLQRNLDAQRGEEPHS